MESLLNRTQCGIKCKIFGCSDYNHEQHNENLRFKFFEGQPPRVVEDFERIRNLEELSDTYDCAPSILFPCGEVEEDGNIVSVQYNKFLCKDTYCDPVERCANNNCNSLRALVVCCIMVGLLAYAGIRALNGGVLKMR